jgi:hypothetical protein
MPPERRGTEAIAKPLIAKKTQGLFSLKHCLIGVGVKIATDDDPADHRHQPADHITDGRHHSLRDNLAFFAGSAFLRVYIDRTVGNCFPNIFIL